MSRVRLLSRELILKEKVDNMRRAAERGLTETLSLLDNEANSSTDNAKDLGGLVDCFQLVIDNASY